MTDPAFVRSIGRAVVLALLAGVAGGLLLVAALAYGSVAPEPGPIHGGGWTNRSRAWLTTRGFHPTEFSAGSDRPYNWTSGSLRFEIPELDRSRSYRLLLNLESPRPEGSDPPRLSWAIDGVPAGVFVVDEDAAVLPIRLPTSERTRAVVTMTVEPTFDPGPNDDRMLGLVVRDVELESERGDWSATRVVLFSLSSAVALVVLGVLLCGAPVWAGALLALLTPTAMVWLTVQDGAFLGDYPATLLNLGMSVAALGIVVAVVRGAYPMLFGSPRWSLAAGLVLAATAIELSFFSHPLVTIGDGIFQVHRSALVQNGSYFFTSITPRPFFEFPYAIGLFVAAIPFWSSFNQDVDHVWLLRTLSLVSNALVGLALYVVAWRVWAQQRTALLVAGLWPFARAPIEALCNANLPNVFGQGMFGVALAVLLLAVSGATVSMPLLLAGGAVLAVSFLSHFSTFSVGVPLVGVVALALAASAGAEGRRRGVWMLVAGALAVAVSYGVYYRHFGEVYRATVDRVLAHEVVDEPGSAIAATPAVKFQRWISGTSDDYGLPGAPLAVAAVAGVVLLVRQRRHDVLTRALVGWAMTWVAFTALGILTAVQMRVNLAAAPVFVCLGAYAIAALFERGLAGRLAASAAALAVVWSGASLWFMCIGR